MCCQAFPCRRALCSHCATERSGKCSTSTGNHPRKGANGLSMTAWFPRESRISGCARWMTLRIGLKSDAGSLIGASAEKRTVRRSANGASRVRSRGERPEERPDRPVARRNRVEHVCERRATRPPELVGVGVDHPVRAELGCRQPGHARDPLVLPQIVAVLADEVDVPFTCVALENVRRPVLRAVVGRDDEIGARVQVKREPGVDDIRLVAREECHDERHRRGSVRRRARRASSASTRCSARTMPSIPTRTEASAA